MNSQLTVEEALDRVPGVSAADARIEPLAGGLTNRVYRIRSGGRDCVLRLDADNAIGIDRSSEAAVMAMAAGAGIAPVIIFSDTDAGILVTEYVHGRVWQSSDLESHDRLEFLADLVRRVHALPLCGSCLDLPGIAGQYAQVLEGRPELKAFARRCVGIIRDLPQAENVTCCHNDIVASNVIECDGLKLIDWEYARDNDPMFDLASLIGFHDLDGKRQQALLGAYTGGADGEPAERLAGQVRVFDAIQWLWLAVRQLRSPRTDQARRLEELRTRIR